MTSQVIANRFSERVDVFGVAPSERKASLEVGARMVKELPCHRMDSICQIDGAIVRALHRREVDIPGIKGAVLVVELAEKPFDKWVYDAVAHALTLNIKVSIPLEREGRQAALIFLDWEFSPVELLDLLHRTSLSRVLSGSDAYVLPPSILSDHEFEQAHRKIKELRWPNKKA